MILKMRQEKMKLEIALNKGKICIIPPRLRQSEKYIFYRQLLLKFPALDLAWSDELQNKWWECFRLFMKDYTHSLSI